MTRDQLLTDIAELAEELADPRHIVTPIHEWTAARNKRMSRAWTTTIPGLLTQLADQISAPGNSQDNDGGRPVPGSRPPLNVAALSVHTQISIASSRWLWSLRQPLRDTPEANIRALVGQLQNIDDDTAELLRAEMRDWARWARILTGWQTPPFRPRVPCPVHGCGKPTLVINLGKQAAICTTCRTTWDDTDGGIRILAEHVRTATDHQAA